MTSNPYLATHFGGSVDFFRNGRANPDHADDFDATTGFTRFPKSKYMTTSVFKPSKPSGPSAPGPKDALTPPDNVFKLNNRFLMNRFPSRPPTPGSSFSASNSGLPQLLRPPLLATGGGGSSFNGDVAVGGGGLKSPASSTPTGETQSSHNEDGDEEEAFSGQTDRAREAAAAAVGSRPESAYTPLDAELQREEKDVDTNQRHWLARERPTTVPVTAFLSKANGTMHPRDVSDGEHGTKASHSMGDALVSSTAANTDEHKAPCHPASAAASSPSRSGEGSPAFSSQGHPGETTVSPTSEKTEERALEGGAEGVNGLTDILQRSRAALSTVQRLLGSQATSTIVERDSGDQEGVPQGTGVATAANYSAPPPLPINTGFHASDEDGRTAVTTTATSSNHPVSPLQDDDFLHCLSPVSETNPQTYPKKPVDVQGDNSRATLETADAVPQQLYRTGEASAMEAQLGDAEVKRRVIATLCSVPAQQAEKCLSRRREQAVGHLVLRPEETPSTHLAHCCLAEDPVQLSAAIPSSRGAAGKKERAHRSRRRDAREHRSEMRGKSKDGRSHASRRGTLPASSDQFADLLAQLGEFLSGNDRGGGLAANSRVAHAVPNGLADSALGGSHSAEDAAAYVPPEPAVQGQRTERLIRRPLAQPVVLVGHRPSQLSLLSRGNPSRSRSANPSGSPSYAQPTESWLQKNLDDDAEW